MDAPKHHDRYLCDHPDDGEMFFRWSHRAFYCLTCSTHSRRDRDVQRDVVENGDRIAQNTWMPNLIGPKAKYNPVAISPAWDVKERRRHRRFVRAVLARERVWADLVAMVTWFKARHRKTLPASVTSLLDALWENGDHMLMLPVSDELDAIGHTNGAFHIRMVMEALTTWTKAKTWEGIGTGNDHTWESEGVRNRIIRVGEAWRHAKYMQSRDEFTEKVKPLGILYGKVNAYRPIYQVADGKMVFHVEVIDAEGRRTWQMVWAPDSNHATFEPDSWGVIDEAFREKALPIVRDLMIQFADKMMYPFKKYDEFNTDHVREAIAKERCERPSYLNQWYGPGYSLCCGCPSRSITCLGVDPGFGWRLCKVCSGSLSGPSCRRDDVAAKGARYPTRVADITSTTSDEAIAAFGDLIRAGALVMPQILNYLERQELNGEYDSPLRAPDADAGGIGERADRGEEAEAVSVSDVPAAAVSLDDPDPGPD